MSHGVNKVREDINAVDTGGIVNPEFVFGCGIVGRVMQAKAPYSKTTKRLRKRPGKRNN
jgi:hypothetical protein